MLSLARKLRERGVLGMNRRNADYVLLNNPRHLYPLVDDKLKTKRLAENAGLSVPPLFGVIEFSGDVKNFSQMIAGQKEFVVKPASGSGGDGIIVIRGQTRELFRKADGSLISLEDLEYHILAALSGIFSLGSQPDKVLVEYCIQFDPVFAKISFQGIPDIRVIVYKGVPVMAMVRLPTRQSGGKANLHQGAIGAGIDITTGQTLTAVWKNDIIREHPDTFEPVGGVQIPHWDRILEISAMTTALTGLGYQGVDIVLDKEKGPVILELNARPGLNIQIANRAGLEPRLKLVDSISSNELSALERCAFAKENFQTTWDAVQAA